VTIRSGEDISIGVAIDHGKAREGGKAFHDLSRARADSHQIPEDQIAVGTTLGGQISEDRIQGDTIPVYIRKDSQTHGHTPPAHVL